MNCFKKVSESSLVLVSCHDLISLEHEFIDAADRSRPVSERLADVAESLEAAAAADTFASTRYYQQRPVGLVSARTLSTGRRSTSVDSAWERTRAKEGGRSLGGKTQGDILLERRVAHRAGDRSRG